MTQTAKSFNYNTQWENEFHQVMNAGQSSVVLLHGNVRDFFEYDDKFLDLKDYLITKVMGERQYKFHYDPQGGLQFTNKENKQEFFRSLQGYDSYHNTNYAQNPPKQPGPAFSLIENIMKLKVMDKVSTAVVINYAEHIMPVMGLGNVNAEVRFLKIAIDKWAQNRVFVDNNVTIFIVVENLAKVDEMISSNPYIPRIYIEKPSEVIRQKFITSELTKWKITTSLEPTVIAKLAAGLSLLQLGRMFANITGNKQTLDMPLIKELKKQFIEAECYGLLEFIEPRFDLANVAGHIQAKKMLKEISQAIKSGFTNHLPMGFLICGPVGTGKTFLVNCFAGEVGIPVVKFLNFRSQYVGQTEANLEKILNLLKSAHPVVVMIDEADAFLGDRAQQGDSGTSNRVFAKLAEFMGNTEYRGKIIWFLMTSRPDLLPIDMKRQGRAEEHIALFHAQNEEEEEALFQALAKKNKIDATKLKFTIAKDKEHTYSGADVESVLVRAKFQSQIKKEDQLSQETLSATAKNFISPNYPLEMELQTLNALRECTNRELIPNSYKSMDFTSLTSRINEIKALLHEG